MPALRRRFRIFSFRYREMMSGMTMGGGILLRLDWELLREHVLAAGAAARGVLGFGGLLRCRCVC